MSFCGGNGNPFAYPRVGFHTIRNHNEIGVRVADEEQVEVSAQDARAGETPHVTRYVLGISLTLIILLFAGLLIYSYR